MVGWSRRNREASERAARYRKWFNSLPPEEQERITREEAERWKKNRPHVIACLILGFFTLFVLWPLACIFLYPRH